MLVNVKFSQGKGIRDPHSLAVSMLCFVWWGVGDGDTVGF